MKTREEVLAYGLSFPYTYQDAPFRDTNWQLVRVHGSKKRFCGLMKRTGKYGSISKSIRNGATFGAMPTMLYCPVTTKTKSIGTRLS